MQNAVVGQDRPTIPASPSMNVIAERARVTDASGTVIDVKAALNSQAGEAAAEILEAADEDDADDDDEAADTEA